jgi:hypothetical protein
MKEISVDEFRALKGQKVAVVSKYRAQPQVYQGHRYASKAELAFKMHLDLFKANGVVLWYLFQVPIHLPAGEGVKGTRYVMDFLVMMKSGTVRGVDVKGKDTYASKIKRSVASSVVPFPIETVTRQRNGSFLWP